MDLLLCLLVGLKCGVDTANITETMDLPVSDGPACEYANGEKYWFQHNKRHRDDGPAIVCANGEKHWYKHGKRHRDDGPAIEWADGYKEYWENGEFIREEVPQKKQ
jgi:hypothetical protein